MSHAIRSISLLLPALVSLGCAVDAGPTGPATEDVPAPTATTKTCIGCGSAGMLYPCPQLCDRPATQGHYESVWTWDHPPPKGHLDDYTHEVPSRPKDLLPVPRLFVHGLHGDRSSWDDWRFNASKLTRGDVPVGADEVGWTSQGSGSATLLTQAKELAEYINATFPNVPEDSIYVYAHSMGALKVETVLQLGFQGQAPYAAAAAKIHQANIFQGAHGGCKATAALGDKGGHGLSQSGCPASKDIGRVNDARSGLGPNWIPGTSETWDLRKITWMGTAHPKSIRYYQMYAHTWSGEKACKGANTNVMTAWICDEAEDQNDGVVYKFMHAPTWWSGFDVAKDAGLLTVVDFDANQCHMRKDKDHEDTWLDPKHDLDVFARLIERDPSFQYFPGVAGHFYQQWVGPTPHYCDAGCYCGVYSAADPGYCGGGTEPVSHGPDSML